MLQTGKHYRVVKALFTRGMGVTLQFLTNIVIGQVFGATGMGMYHIYSTWMVMLSDIASMGLPVYTMRTLSNLQQQQNIDAIRNILNRILLVCLLTGLLICLPILFLPGELSGLLLGDSRYSEVLVYAALAAMLFLFLRVLSEAVKAIGHTNLGISVESMGLSFGILAGMGVMIIFALPQSIETLLLAHVIAILSILCVLYLLWLKLLNRQGRGQGQPDAYRMRSIISRSLLFLWFGMILNVWFVNLPVFILPHVATTAEIGEFGVAFRLVMLATTILVSLSALFGPRFVSHHQARDYKSLKQELRHSQWYSLAAYLPFFVIFILFPDVILSIFGPEFIAARPVLIILAIAQLINSATGLCGYFLIMVHQEKLELLILISTFILMTLLMLLLGFEHGMLGITVAYAIGIAVKNLASLAMALRFITRFKNVTNG